MLTADSLYFSYTGTEPYILNNIHFNISGGEYVSIVGDNGCGKSTLVKLILGFLKPVSGQLTINAKRTGYLPQRSESANSDFPITVFEMLNAYRKLLKIKNPDSVPESLSRIGMESFKNALIGTLSGGQYQKVLIARAMMGSPDLLILDEPSTGVDVKSQAEIYKFIKTANEENGITVVSVEHNLTAAIKNSTLIYHLSDGHGHLCTPEKYSAEFLGKGDNPYA